MRDESQVTVLSAPISELSTYICEHGDPEDQHTPGQPLTVSTREHEPENQPLLILDDALDFLLVSVAVHIAP